MVTLEFVPYNEISNLDSDKKIIKLLDIVKGESIVVMQGRLDSNEETKLIEMTMGEINNSGFKGVEICTIYPKAGSGVFEFLRSGMAKVLLGKREGVTVIGPASIVKEIKRDPNKIQLFTKNKKRRE